MTLYHGVDFAGLKLEGNLFLAPVAGYSDRAFRSLCVKYGASYCTTEMVSSEALVRGSPKTERLTARAPGEARYAVQIFGADPDVMGRAARIVIEKTGCECIDINAGCPAPKITKGGAGSALMKDSARLGAVVKAVRDAADGYAAAHPARGAVGVTVKIRSGWDSATLTWKECAAAAIDAGADAITIHARTRAQGYSGRADWGIQRELVGFAAERCRVFGSGDALTPESAEAMLRETGVDAVMFARGAIGDPFIFRRTRELLTTGTYRTESPAERIVAGFEELAMNIEERGEKSACLYMRKKFCAYCAGLPGVKRMRERIVSACTLDDYRRIFEDALR